MPAKGAKKRSKVNNDKTQVPRWENPAAQVSSAGTYLRLERDESNICPPDNDPYNSVLRANAQRLANFAVQDTWTGHAWNAPTWLREAALLLDLLRDRQNAATEAQGRLAGHKART